MVGVPGAGHEVGLQAPDDRRDLVLGELRPSGLRRPYIGVEERFGPRPKRVDEAVLAVDRSPERVDPGSPAEERRQLRGRRRACALDRNDRGEVVLLPASESSVRITSGPLVTRRISASTDGQSWPQSKVARQLIDASNWSSSNGSRPRSGAAPVTSLFAGAYVPAPGLT